MSEFVNVYIPSRRTRSSADSHTLKIPCVRTKICGHRSFAYQRPTTSNDLLFALRHKNSLSAFKSVFENSSFFFTIRLRLQSTFVLFVYLIVVVIIICAGCVYGYIWNHHLYIVYVWLLLYSSLVLCVCMIFVQCVLCIFVVLLYMLALCIYIELILD